MGVLAHDGCDDPCFISANIQATNCFNTTQNEFMGLHSRDNVSEVYRSTLNTLLSYVKNNEFVSNYTMPRVDKYNQHFCLNDRMVWLLQHNGHQLFGQALLFWPDDFKRPKSLL